MRKKGGQKIAKERGMIFSPIDSLAFLVFLKVLDDYLIFPKRKKFKKKAKNKVFKS